MHKDCLYYAWYDWSEEKDVNKTFKNCKILSELKFKKGDITSDNQITEGLEDWSCFEPKIHEK